MALTNQTFMNAAPAHPIEPSGNARTTASSDTHTAHTANTHAPPSVKTTARAVGTAGRHPAVRRAAYPAAYASLVACHPVATVTTARRDGAVMAATKRSRSSFMISTVATTPDTPSSPTD